MTRIDRRSVLVFLLIAALALAMRLPGLGSFMTADEENWMFRSAQFWHSLFFDRNVSGTFLTSHPGATTMWVAGAGIIAQEYRLGVTLAQDNVQHFRRAALIPLAITTSFLIGLAAWQLEKLLRRGYGIIAGIFVAVDPYLTGLSQVVHLDALLALTMLNAFLALLIFRENKSRRWLAAAGILMGLALATKLMVALWLVGWAIIIIAWTFPKEVATSLKTLGLFFLVALATFAIVWPAVLTQADFQTGYIVRDARGVATQEHVASDDETDSVGNYFYARAAAARLTPWTLAGTVLCLVISTVGRVRAMRWFILYAAGFLVFVSLPAKQGDRYALPAFVAFTVLAGWAFAYTAQWLKEKYRLPSLVQWGSVAVVSVAAILLCVRWSPYAIAYSNHWLDVRPLHQQGWGEGLDQAATWLNQHPLGKNLTIASWYPAVTAPYFQGKTFSLSSRDDYRVGYVVVYRNMGDRGNEAEATSVLEEVSGKRPVFTGYIKGVPYVWIYETLHVGNFTKHVGELAGPIEVGQTVTPKTDTWSQIDIGFATFSSRHNTEDVILEIRPDITSNEVLRTVRINAMHIIDNEWAMFSFEPLRDTQNKSFYVTLRSPSSHAGNAVTVRYIDVDILPGQMTLRRAPLKPGQQTSDFLKPGDIAYRLPD
jgi:4-amino-4-deoxy-L-arabinose transferase-like glycosyltransferase